MMDHNAVPIATAGASQMTKRPNIETLAEVADRLMAVRSSLNPNQHEFMWNELTLLAQDVRRLSGTEPQTRQGPPPERLSADNEAVPTELGDTISIDEMVWRLETRGSELNASAVTPNGQLMLKAAFYIKRLASHVEAVTVNEPQAACEWQPIKTAPKSSKDDYKALSFLAWCPDETAPDGGDQRIVWWEPRMNKGAGCWWGDRDLIETPTHWKPLGSPPLSRPEHKL